MIERYKNEMGELKNLMYKLFPKEKEKLDNFNDGQWENLQHNIEVLCVLEKLKSSKIGDENEKNN